MKREVYIVWYTPNKEEGIGQVGWPSMDGKRIAYERKEQAEYAMIGEPPNKSGTLSVKRFVEASKRRKS